MQLYYYLRMPSNSNFYSVYRHVGILVGTMTMELGGDVSITCKKTGYTAEIAFKLKVSKLLKSLLFRLLIIAEETR